MKYVIDLILALMLFCLHNLHASGAALARIELITPKNIFSSDPQVTIKLLGYPETDDGNGPHELGLSNISENNRPASDIIDEAGASQRTHYSWFKLTVTKEEETFHFGITNQHGAITTHKLASAEDSASDSNIESQWCSFDGDQRYRVIVDTSKQEPQLTVDSADSSHDGSGCLIL